MGKEALGLGALGATHAIGNTIGKRDLLRTVLTPKTDSDHARTHMRSRMVGPSPNAAQTVSSAQSVLLSDGRLEPVAIFLAIGGENAYRQCRIEHVVFLEGFDERLESFLRPRFTPTSVSEPDKS